MKCWVCGDDVDEYARELRINTAMDKVRYPLCRGCYKEVYTAMLKRRDRLNRMVQEYGE